MLKYLKKVESDHKTHLLRFKNLPDDYWHDFYEKQAASMWIDEEDWEHTIYL